MNNAAALENVLRQKILLILYLTTEFQGPPPISVIYKDFGNTKLYVIYTTLESGFRLGSSLCVLPSVTQS